MKTRKKIDWVIVHDGTQGENAYALECLRCGRKQRFALPISVSVYLAAGKAFEKMHKRCEEKIRQDLQD